MYQIDIRVLITFFPHIRIVLYELREASSDEIPYVIIPASSSVRNSYRTLFLSCNETDRALQNTDFASLLIGNRTFLADDTILGARY